MDKLTTELRSWNMSRIRSSNTKPEILVRSLLHRMGFRFRLHRKDLPGYAISEDGDQIDLFVSLYGGVDELTPIPDSETKTAAEQCLRFLAKCAEGRLAATMDKSNEAYGLALNIQECFPNLDQIRIYVLTDKTAKAKFFKARETNGKTIKLEIMDIERLHRHWSEGKPRDEITINFNELTGSPLPCVCIPGNGVDYDCALTVIPGQAMFHVYEKFGARLLEANVRSFLSTSKKVNAGIRDTIKGCPERFMAYNNGIVIIADEVRWEVTPEGGPGILWLKGMQIVNGGQTTASIYFAKKKHSEIDLGRVKVPAKIIVLKSEDAEQEENLISDISRYANSQNAVQQADLSANKPYHIAIEKLSTSIYCPDGVGRWFYERAAGSYTTMLAREGTTPARLKKLKDSIPPARRFTKTDLAKYVNAWAQKPHFVSLGNQKNFKNLMEELEANKTSAELDTADFKRLIAKTILFRVVQKLVRPLFQAFQANIAAYLVSLLSLKLGDKLDLNRIWLKQDLSPELKQQLVVWAGEVHAILHKSANGRMVSEWAKKPECWIAIQDADFNAHRLDIPEIIGSKLGA
jgi:hypothetical protein